MAKVVNVKKRSRKKLRIRPVNKALLKKLPKKRKTVKVGKRSKAGIGIRGGKARIRKVKGGKSTRKMMNRKKPAPLTRAFGRSKSFLAGYEEGFNSGFSKGLEDGTAMEHTAQVAMVAASTQAVLAAQEEQASAQG